MGRRARGYDAALPQARMIIRRVTMSFNEAPARALLILAVMAPCSGLAPVLADRPVASAAGGRSRIPVASAFRRKKSDPCSFRLQAEENMGRYQKEWRMLGVTYTH